ncbi:rod shape determining protein RodA [Candidatus Kinetoplastibacterium blastocrithidii TCC012E]|uniref:Peptidoglycan glycosyltransferase MrdB n=1 Tax=Candidatus Kinetoplastidibacterium blastocrithidiae TCC012E TaxID=1208922 RepID=M1M4S5_9PROT|nr:rod shape-determining protein RodA [Candidatus Kinetoplastibacterium blastocrithidii]AFZ83268.1 rod shape determining protein RodA [Candidatus Kinetoplastibacterium blastocrithidii (ex Strigomonas culicis)]AGF50084.1 rod shape determining protein RodA [Candidatus Kinetoplastibacterium blastocrithidii TCC012E]
MIYSFISYKEIFRLKNFYVFILQKLINCIDFYLLIILIAFMTIDMAVMYSAVGPSSYRFIRQFDHFLFSLFIMLLISFIPQHLLRNFSIPFYVLGVVLLLCVEFFGETVKGATRWLSLGFIRIQPSEILKIAVPMMLSYFFDMQDREYLTVRSFLIASLILLVPCFFILIQPDLGTALLVFGAGISVIYFAGLPFRVILPIFLTLTFIVSCLMYYEDVLCADSFRWLFFHDYQKNRICTLLNPSSDPLGRGFHTMQSIIAVGSGGLYGKGYMLGTQTHLDFIPERSTDFIFAVFAEEFGLYGCIFLLILYSILIFRGLLISMQASSQFSKLLAGSISMMIFIYVFVNIGMVTGILPVVGVPLPFMSYGGSALLTMCIACGILMNIGRAADK